MTSLMDTPQVTSCAADGCSYNADHTCHAHAITVGDDADCATFIDLSTRGGLDTVTAHVGACQRTGCVHNNGLECGADAIRVGPAGSTADCLTYEAR